MSVLVNSARPLSELLRRHRRDLDLTIEGLAERSGISDRTISDIERGISRGPQRRTMLALADALGLRDPERERLLRSARSGRHLGADDEVVVDLEPHRLADFTGRESEIADVVAQLTLPGTTASAPVVLSGAPGVGKTSIAIEALHRCASRNPSRLFVDLGGLDAVPLTSLQVLQSLLRQLTGAPEVPKSLGEAAAAWRAAVVASPAAVLLDDAADEAQVRPVLSPDRSGVVVVTSRRILAGLEGARRIAVGPLPREESIEFLRRILPEAQAQTGDLDQLAGFCDDVPLALRIAGNRLATQPTWTIEDFLQRLRSEERRLGALVAGDLALESAFALSYDLLAETSRTLFRGLSLLDGASFDARLAGALCALPEDQAQQLLDGLVALGLVEALQGDRYRLHDLLRLYAASRLRSEEPAEEISVRRRRLRDWLLSTTIAAGTRFEPGTHHDSPGAVDGLLFDSDEEARRWLTTEAEHWYSAYRAAASRGDHDRVLAVADSLHWFSDLWLGWGRWHEFFAASAASAAALDHAAQHARHLGYLAWSQLVETGAPEAARATAGAALLEAQRAADIRQRGWAHFYLAWSSLNLDDLPAAQSSADAAVSDLAESGDAEGQLQARALGARIRSRYEPEVAMDEYRALAEFVCRVPDLPRNIRVVTATNAHAVTALILLSLDRHEEAIVEASVALESGRPGEFPAGQASAHRHRGLAALALGRSEPARADLEAALALGAGARSAAWLTEVRAALLQIELEDPNIDYRAISIESR